MFVISVVRPRREEILKPQEAIATFQERRNIVALSSLDLFSVKTIKAVGPLPPRTSWPRRVQTSENGGFGSKQIVRFPPTKAIPIQITTDEEKVSRHSMENRG